MPRRDLAPLLRRDPHLAVQVQDLIGGDLIMRFNALYPPFDNPAMRRAILPAINQAEFMTAVNGDDRTLWRDRVGAFSVGKPMSTDAGVDVMRGDVEASRRLVKAAAYDGKPIVVMIAGDYPALAAVGTVGADLLKQVGFNVDIMTLDYGTYTQRRASKAEPGKGGWNVLLQQLQRLQPAGPGGPSRYLQRVGRMAENP